MLLNGIAGGAISGGTLAIPGSFAQAVSVQAELREQQRQERIREIGARFDQTGDIRLLDELFELALDDKGAKRNLRGPPGRPAPARAKRTPTGVRDRGRFSVPRSSF